MHGPKIDPYKGTRAQPAGSIRFRSNSTNSEMKKCPLISKSSIIVITLFHHGILVLSLIFVLEWSRGSVDEDVSLWNVTISELAKDSISENLVQMQIGELAKDTISHYFSKCQCMWNPICQGKNSNASIKILFCLLVHKTKKRDLMVIYIFLWWELKLNFSC